MTGSHAISIMMESKAETGDDSMNVKGDPGTNVQDTLNGDPGFNADPECEACAAPLLETMNGDASAGPAAATVGATTAESDEDSSGEDDTLLLPEDEVDHVYLGESRSVLPMSSNLCSFNAAKEFIGGTRGPRTLLLQDDVGSNEEDPPDDEMEHTAPKQSQECLRNGLNTIGCEGRYEIDLDSAAPCPMRPAGPSLRKPKGELSDEKFLAPCPGLAGKGEKSESESKDDSRTSPKPNKKRTWRYYPPPTNDTDKVPIDVIDHESEVLIIRREPPPPPKGICNVTASSFCQS